MKYSFIIPYYKRPTLYNTLISYEYFYKDRKDYEVILVVDKKNDENDILEVDNIIEKFKDTINIKKIDSVYSGYNPAPLFNLGGDKSTGKYLVITNPECFHTTNILKKTDELLKRNENQYIICGCLQVLSLNDKIPTFNDFKYIPAIKRKDIYMPPTGKIYNINDPKNFGGNYEWYQHTKYCNRNLHFCSFISRINYKLIKGFDQLYSRGIGWEDNDFLEKIKTSNITISPIDDLLIFHMFHSRKYQEHNKELYEINYKYYLSKWHKESVKIQKVIEKQNTKKDDSDRTKKLSMEKIKKLREKRRLLKIRKGR